VTPEYLGMLGEEESAGEFDLDTFGNRIHPDDAPGVIALIEACTRGDIEEYRTDYRIRHADGSWIWMLSIGRVVERDADGRAVRILGSHTDITSSKLAEEALRQSEEQLNCAQHFAHIGSWTWDIAADDLQWSDEMFNLFGIEQATFTGSLSDVIATAIHPDDREAVERVNVEVIENSNPTPPQYRVIWPDGSVHVVWAEAGELLRDEAGRPVRLSGTVQDITERTQTQNALVEAVRDLERSNHDLEQFAYIASHDLQEPLRMVSMYTELLRKRYHGQLDADADDFIDYAVEGAQRMSLLLGDLLDYSRVGTRGKEPQSVSAQSAMEQVLANLRAQIEDTGAAISASDLPAVMADESQLVRVFQNLISNSLKFSRDGVPPLVSVTAEREGAHWRFCIADNGIGIGIDYFEQVFETFRRLQPRGAYPGTGIGLAICKRIIERLGGTIWVERSDDTGTTFCFTLPAAP
jgi:PAS domain S-box-containing protein